MAAPISPTCNPGDREQVCQAGLRESGPQGAGQVVPLGEHQGARDRTHVGWQKSPQTVRRSGPGHAQDSSRGGSAPSDRPVGSRIRLTDPSHDDPASAGSPGPVRRTTDSHPFALDHHPGSGPYGTPDGVDSHHQPSDDAEAGALHLANRNTDQGQAAGGTRHGALAGRAVNLDAVTGPEITDAGRARAPGGRGAEEETRCEAGHKCQVNEDW